MIHRRLLAVAFAVFAVPVAAAPSGHRIVAELGLRAFLRDDTAVTVGLAIDVARFGDLALTFRPMVLVRDRVELRASITLEQPILDIARVYGGAGVVYNESSSGETAPLITLGGDLTLFDRLILDGHINQLYKSNDVDTELFGAAGYVIASP